MSEDSGHQARMDRNYRLQRHIYDLTRKNYLFGRDRLLRELRPAPGECILESGCGTARNLIALGRRAPTARHFGLDASSLMLQTAAQRVARAGLGAQIELRCALAEQVTPLGTFGLERPFDAVFFSYALSMIPPWREALEAGWNALRPGGRLLIVDFWDAAGLPAWCGRLLRAWLHKFHTHPRPEIIDAVAALPDGGPMEVDPVGPRYAFLIKRFKL